MQTIVYLIRHSMKISNDMIKFVLNNESKQILNEKIPLAIEGEKRAAKLAKLKAFENIEAIFSSNYTRTIQTAKYLAEIRNLKINVDERLNERKHGIYEGEINLERYYQEDFKNQEGESPREVKNRMYQAFENAITKNKGKEIAIFTHGASMTFLLMNWCKLEHIDNNKRKRLSFRGKVIVDKTFNQPEIFKIILNDDNEVVEITNIEISW